MSLEKMVVSSVPLSVENDLCAVGVKFNQFDRDPEFQYERETSRLWMWVGRVTVYDSGRIVVAAPEFIWHSGYEDCLAILLGHVEDVWRGKHDPKRHRWYRLRKTSKREGGYREHVYVQAPDGRARQAALVAMIPMHHKTERDRVIEVSA